MGPSVISRAKVSQEQWSFTQTLAMRRGEVLQFAEPDRAVPHVGVVWKVEQDQLRAITASISDLR
jgi:hypothetical protein